jgi:hypothetical protein
MKQVKYEVTGLFGDLDRGEIIKAYLVAEDLESNTALLFHPRNPKTGLECAVFELTMQHDNGIYVIFSRDSYINVSEPSKNLRQIIKIIQGEK